jgi:hypothetical protein
MVIEHMTHWTRLALKKQRILLISLQRGINKSGAGILYKGE